jgi:large subunit ribosomal protein L2
LFNDGYVLNFEYNPGSATPLLKLYHENDPKGFFSYILAPKGVKVFDKLKTINEMRKNLYLIIGDCSVLSNFEAGDFVHNVDPIKQKRLTEHHQPLFARAAGTCCQVLQQYSNKYVTVRLPSGSQRLCSNEGKATLGILSNEKHHLQTLGKAGASRHRGIRPRVRGVAMNPIDHPHGGGQGKTSGGRPSVTPQGRPTKGQPTRNKKKRNPLILSPRKK